MNTKVIASLIGTVLFLLMFNSSTTAAPKDPCTKPNPPPECNAPPPPPPPAAAVVNSASVDWLNQAIIVRGENLDPAPEFSLGGSALLATSNVTSTSLNIPFNADIANAVLTRGNYQLNVDGTDLLSLFVKSQIIDPAAVGCPCAGEWINELALLVEGGLPAPECTLSPPVSGAPDDAIFVTIPTTDIDFPYVLVGAAYEAADPVNSVCSLTQFNLEGATEELLNLRINETQQQECAALVNDSATLCATIIP
jgi:hypothetical protein